MYFSLAEQKSESIFLCLTFETLDVPTFFPDKMPYQVLGLILKGTLVNTHKSLFVIVSFVPTIHSTVDVNYYHMVAFLGCITERVLLSCMGQLTLPALRYIILLYVTT